MTFGYKIINNENSPKNLKESFTFNYNLNKKYSLRNSNEIQTPRISNLNNYGEQTFSYFFSKLINTICVKDLNIDFNFFKNNINLIFNKFRKNFSKFDLNYSIYIY